MRRPTHKDHDMTRIHGELKMLKIRKKNGIQVILKVYLPQDIVNYDLNSPYFSQMKSDEINTQRGCNRPDLACALAFAVP